MKALSAKAISAAVLVLGMVAATAALAHGGGYPRARVGVFIGGPVFSPWWYPYGYPYGYYSPYPYPYAVARPGPTEYIEQGQSAAAPASGSDPYWYYCPEAKAYYPYVDKCAAGWQRVKPQPPF
jgi:hypothetical protein